MSIETIADRPCRTGEGPLWHPDENALYWTDIPAGRLYRYDPETARDALVYEGRPVGGFTIQHDGALLLFRDRGNVARFHNGTLTTAIDEIPGLEETRFNDVIADPAGRVFAGTMSFGNAENGALYRIDPDGTYRVVSDGHITPNGMGFTLDRRRLYFTDSRKRRISCFGYDPGTGTIRGQDLFTETTERDSERIGRSDGMTVDEEGFVWSARWGGGHILRYAPDGSIAREIAMPARDISSLTFGGPGLDDLYITSAGGDRRTPDNPLAGALFRFRPGVRGRPEFRSRIEVPLG